MIQPINSRQLSDLERLLRTLPSKVGREAVRVGLRAQARHQRNILKKRNFAFIDRSGALRRSRKVTARKTGRNRVFLSLFTPYALYVEAYRDPLKLSARLGLPNYAKAFADAAYKELRKLEGAIK